MLCDGCKQREANVMLHMITNGQLATRSLCAECARKAHGEMAQALSTMGLRMEGLNGMVEKPAEPEAIRLPNMICSTCRTPYETIDHDTVFGCPSCYQAFHQMVIDFLSGLQESAVLEHRQMEGQRLPATARESLSTRLQDAIRAEDYEQAAALRDQLNELEKQVSGKGERVDE